VEQLDHKHVDVHTCGKLVTHWYFVVAKCYTYSNFSHFLSLYHSFMQLR